MARLYVLILDIVGRAEREILGLNLFPTCSASLDRSKQALVLEDECLISKWVWILFTQVELLGAVGEPLALSSYCGPVSGPGSVAIAWSILPADEALVWGPDFPAERKENSVRSALRLPIFWAIKAHDMP